MCDAARLTGRSNHLYVGGRQTSEILVRDRV